MSMSSPREIAESGEILRAVVGSTVHGLSLPGHDDSDEMGVCIEPPESALGLSPFEHWTHRTKPEGERSGPGDLDLVVYSLRKWARLAANGNPTVLLLLFAPREFIRVYSPAGERLRRNAWRFASRRAGRAFLGYLTAQRQRLLGERGQMRVKRPELVEAHGFDTKYAGHVLRLAFQGVEFLRTGRLTLPMIEPEREEVLRVRRGETDLQATLTLAGELEREMEDLLDSSPLPPEPDRDGISEMLASMYRDWWESPEGGRL